MGALNDLDHEKLARAVRSSGDEIDARRHGGDPMSEDPLPNLAGLGVYAPGATPFPLSPAVHEAPVKPHGGAISLEQTMTRLVRRIAWSGDAHRGSARLEVGAGSLEGATLTIHAEDGVLHVALELPPGVDRSEWRDRIAQRLSARGLQVAALDVE